MVDFYHGVPGSGKSLYAAYQILETIDHGGHVVTNIPVDFGSMPWSIYKRMRCRRSDRVHYVSNADLNAKLLVSLSREIVGDRPNREGQILLVIDECETVFNSRSWTDKGRNAWVQFFSLHRKLSYNCILIAPSFEMCDKQIRECAEILTEFRSVKNFFPVFGFLVPRTFIGISRYKGQIKSKGNILKRVFFRYHRSWGSIYNTFAIFGDFENTLLEQPKKK